MTVIIAPFTIDPDCNSIEPQVWQEEKERHSTRSYTPITYWRIYLDDKYISYTSSKELAEKTKLWVEKWLKARN